jgi:hypothetical protein
MRGLFRRSTGKPVFFWQKENLYLDSKSLNISGPQLGPFTQSIRMLTHADCIPPTVCEPVGPVGQEKWWWHGGHVFWFPYYLSRYWLIYVDIGLPLRSVWNGSFFSLPFLTTDVNSEHSAMGLARNTPYADSKRSYVLWAESSG